ncbi:hypothetical protein WJX72_009700 [[Myrmecia] bisecta]|uniref:AB hydrolase-1 domain-containing protein n=1 Tax=[Myrmecia] bisecta TaxID=41462 RepID=A0AAW1P251_9CHLO
MIDRLIAWVDQQARSTDAAGRFFGKFIGASSIGLIGHSMGGGLVAQAAGAHPAVKSVVLLDPVNYVQGTDVEQYLDLATYGQPVMIVTVGVHCLDRNQCSQPPYNDGTVAVSNAVLPNGCTPSWWCCDWDSQHPGVTGSSGLLAFAANADGALSFLKSAPAGSWVLNLSEAGHMSFLYYDPTTQPPLAIKCPSVAPSRTILPEVLPAISAWVDFAFNGEPATGLLNYTSRPEVQQLMQLRVV